MSTFFSLLHRFSLLMHSIQQLCCCLALHYIEHIQPHVQAGKELV